MRSYRPAAQLLICTAVFLLSCQSRKFELSTNPEILRDGDIAIQKMSLLGLKLGDPESTIPQDIIVQRTSYLDGHPSGWLICKGGARFRVSNGRIVEFALDSQILQKLDVLREDQIELTFGKADKITTEDYGSGIVSQRTYTYIPRHMLVRWSVRENRLNGVSVSR